MTRRQQQQHHPRRQQRGHDPADGCSTCAASTLLVVLSVLRLLLLSAQQVQRRRHALVSVAAHPLGPPRPHAHAQCTGGGRGGECPLAAVLPSRSLPCACAVVSAAESPVLCCSLASRRPPPAPASRCVHCTDSVACHWTLQATGGSARASASGRKQTQTQEEGTPERAQRGTSTGNPKRRGRLARGDNNRGNKGGAAHTTTHDSCREEAQTRVPWIQRQAADPRAGS